MSTAIDRDTEHAPVRESAVTATQLRRQTSAAVRVLLVLTVLLGVVYPAVIWGACRLPGLHENAEGSVLPGVGGSSLIGIDPVPANPAADPWFHTRPSASAPDSAVAGLGPADPTTSGGSNLGADAEALGTAVPDRRAAIATREGVDPAAVPPDALTASGSGLDPQISPAYAALQVPPRRPCHRAGGGPRPRPRRRRHRRARARRARRTARERDGARRRPRGRGARDPMRRSGAG